MRTSQSTWHSLAEAWMTFSQEGPVWGTLRRARESLEDSSIPHAVVGGLAVFLHGHRRMTTDVDILVRPDDRDGIVAALRSAGLTLRRGEFVGSDDIRLHLLLAGEPEGLDWARAIRFPDPADDASCSEIDGFRTVTLVRLLEMKLACGLSNPRRPQDIADALRLMEIHGLDKRFVSKLHPLLRRDFKRLVDVIRSYPDTHGGA